jgi:phytoene synthase
VVDLGAAYATCERVAAAHGENFPVASRLLPRAMRPHVAAVYAFARAADDFADEGDRSPAERFCLLDDWHRRLRACAGAPGGDPHGRVSPSATEAAEAVVRDRIFLALGATIRTYSLPLELLEDLLSAFRQDVTVTRYETWADLLDYCRRSANPVGRLLLRIAGYDDAPLDVHSDHICTALQLTNFWQDLRIDFERGRIYLPREEMRAHQAREDELARPLGTDHWPRAMAAAVRRTRTLFAAGRPLCDGVSGRLRFELRATWLGGMRILDQLEARRFDPLASRPRLTLGDMPPLAWRMATWSRT